MYKQKFTPVHVETNCAVYTIIENENKYTGHEINMVCKSVGVNHGIKCERLIYSGQPEDKLYQRKIPNFSNIRKLFFRFTSGWNRKSIWYRNLSKSKRIILDEKI